MSRIELSNVVIGDKISDGIYCLSAIKKNNNGYFVTLKDKSGELSCELANERFSEEIASFVGGAVKVDFIVKNGLNTAPLGVIKRIAKADEGSYKPSELFVGLSKDKVVEYTNIIVQCIEQIPNAGYRSLVKCILDDNMIARLSSMPASLAYHGKYMGGALACTATVTKMVMQAAYQYCKLTNGLYTPMLDWSVLLTASLLQCVSVVDYFTSEMPFRKSDVGIERGEISLLQQRIEKTYFEHPEYITDIQLARILNVLSASVPMKSGIKSTGTEGTILRQCRLLYEELDMLDAEKAGYEVSEEENYFYDAKLRRNIKLPEREEKEVA
jgi:hypothetical protein